MQRYGDLGVNTNIGAFSSFVCCDRHADLRQKRGLDSFFDGKGGAWRDRSTTLEMTVGMEMTCSLFHF